ncbi:MAG: hypothetical protein IJS32_08375 [Kiritimatiellae bacterium]|nr:hypothetical protein [Kiritimatiellia bacterium]
MPRTSQDQTIAFEDWLLLRQDLARDLGDPPDSIQADPDGERTRTARAQRLRDEAALDSLLPTEPPF